MFSLEERTLQCWDWVEAVPPFPARQEAKGPKIRKFGQTPIKFFCIKSLKLIIIENTSPCSIFQPRLKSSPKSDSLGQFRRTRQLGSSICIMEDRSVGEGEIFYFLRKEIR